MDEARLRIRIEELEEENRQLRELLAPRTLPPEWWKLTRTEGELLSALRAAGNGGLSIERAMAALYGLTSDAPDAQVVTCHICNIRRKLRSVEASIAIKTIRGYGYKLVPESLFD